MKDLQPTSLLHQQEWNNQGQYQTNKQLYQPYMILCSIAQLLLFSHLKALPKPVTKCIYLLVLVNKYKRN